MNAIRSYVRPTTGPKATKLKPITNGKGAALDASLVGTTPPHALNNSTGSPGPSATRHAQSRPVSAHPDGDFRNNSPQDIDEIKNAIAINWVFQVQNENMWNGNSGAEGVVLRKAPRHFIACPDDLAYNSGGFFDAASELNAKVCSHQISFTFILLIS